MSRCSHCGTDLGAIPADREVVTYDLHSRFLFGKYQGRTVEEILDENPSYIVWAQQNVKPFCVSNALLNKASQLMDARAAYPRGFDSRFPEDDDPDWGDPYFFRPGDTSWLE